MTRFKLISALIVAVLFASGTQAAVTFDAVANSNCGTSGSGGSKDPACGGSGTSLTYALTVGSGSNRALAVVIHRATGIGSTTPSVSSVTYAGVALTQISTYNNPSTGTAEVSELWALPAGTQPSSGTNNVVVTLASAISGSVHSGAFAVSGVDQTTTFTSYNSNGGVSATAAVTLSSSGTDDLVISACVNGASITSTAQTQRWLKNQNASNAGDNDGGATAAGGTTSLSWTVSNDNWNVIGASFKAATAAAPVKHRVIMD